MTEAEGSDPRTPPPAAPQTGGGTPGDPWGAVPPQYGQPPYGPPPGYPPPYQYGYPYGYQPRGGTNGMAIAAMVCGICGFMCLVPGIVGIILGFVSLPEIKRSQQGGRGQAIAGIVVGAAWVVLFVVLLAVSSSQNN